MRILCEYPEMKGYQPLGKRCLRECAKKSRSKNLFREKKSGGSPALRGKKRGRHEYRANPGCDGKPPIREFRNPANAGGGYAARA